MEDPTQEANKVRAQLRESGWYTGQVPSSMEEMVAVTKLLTRLAQLAEQIQPDNEEAARLKVRCMLEAATRGGGDEGVIGRLVDLGRPALGPLMNVILDRSEHAFRRRAAIEAIAAMKPLPIPADSAAFPLVYVIRNPVGEDYKVLVLAIRALGSLGARVGVSALEGLEEQMKTITPFLGAHQATTIERERTAALTAILAGSRD